MTKQEEIAHFLNNHITLPRCTYWNTPVYVHPVAYPAYQPRPSTEQLAREFLQMTEYQALQLGNWLGTTQGEVIAEAITLVLPPFYAADAQLLIDALKLAAQLQHQDGLRTAGHIVIGVAGIATAIAAIRAA
jgi:hypothetical protein